jgi:hypothetical protein
MGEKEKVCFPIGYAAIVLSALSHCGGANGTGVCVYCVFAYIVSNEVDYTDGEGGTVERDFEDDIEKEKQGGGGNKGKRFNKRKRKRGREMISQRRFRYDDEYGKKGIVGSF